MARRKRMERLEYADDGALLIDPVSAAARMGKHPLTISRWITGGLQAPGGERILLPHIRRGRRILINERDLDAFERRLAEAYVSASADAAERADEVRDRVKPARPGRAERRAAEIEAANAECDRLGF